MSGQATAGAITPPELRFRIDTAQPIAMGVGAVIEYALRHTHRFTATPDGTRIDDEVRYRLPSSPLGALAGPPVAWQLARIFRYRQERVAALLAAQAGS